MKSKKKLSLKKMNVAQLETIKGGNLDVTITARNTSPILCNYASYVANCQPTPETFVNCK